MLARLPGAILIAVAVTFSLFFGMQFLIAISDKPQEETLDIRIVDTRIPPEQTEVQRKERLPEKPDEPEEPPEPPKFDTAATNKPGATGTDLAFEFDGGIDTGGGIEFDVADREVLPIVRVEPVYPDRAAQRGIEGYVVLEFTVLASGEVDSDSIMIIQAEPSSIFNRAATRAVRKWKYRPKIENGQPVPQYGIQTQLTFQLDN
ncbi:MAG: energy transducer TonB [Sphingomonadales bacterium]|jgi:protein TonB